MIKVSIIIPAYKAEKYIAATVHSVLKQTYKNFEVLIIDDGSPDQSVEICQQFTDPRIKIICQKNRGVAAARNTGIRQAQGEYIAFLDADDLWLPQKLEKHVEHLNSSLDVGISFSRSAFIDSTGKPLGIYQLSKLKDITPLDILCRTPIGNGSVAVIRREVLEAIRFQENHEGVMEDCYFNPSRQLHPSEDVECWLRIAVLTPWQIEGLAEPLTLYRVNPEGHSAQLLKKLRSWEKMLSIVRSYAPEQVDQWEKPAMAYQLRHLARRAVTLGVGSTAVELMHQALMTHKKILFEEPHRTLLTLSATYCLWFLPSSFYLNLQSLAMNWAGVIQKRRILQDQV